MTTKTQGAWKMNQGQKLKLQNKTVQQSAKDKQRQSTNRNNDRTGSEGNTETKHTDTDYKTRNR